MHKRKRNLKRQQHFSFSTWLVLPPLHGQQEKLEENNSAIKNGVFDVDIDGKVVYSKHTTGRFPNQGELLMLI